MLKTGLTEFDAVIAVARLGSFRAAATDLGMSSSALSHAVAALETRLGVRLFNRTTRSVSMTDAGEQFIARVAPALAEIGGAIEGINSHRETPAGTLRINTSAGAARMILTPIILDYMHRYPDMNIVLVTEGRLVDIVGQGFDAGIRLAEAVPQDMIAVPIGGDVRMVVVGSPTYLEGREIPAVPADLLRHRCIRARMATGAIWRWEFEQRGEVVEIKVPGALTLDEMTLMLEAALAGAGLAYLNEWAVREDIAEGRLIPVLEDWSPPYPGLCLYYPGRKHVPAGLRALIDLIREGNKAGDVVKRSEGRRPPLNVGDRFRREPSFNASPASVVDWSTAAASIAANVMARVAVTTVIRRRVSKGQKLPCVQASGLRQTVKEDQWLRPWAFPRYLVAKRLQKLFRNCSIILSLSFAMP